MIWLVSFLICDYLEMVSGFIFRFAWARPKVSELHGVLYVEHSHRSIDLIETLRTVWSNYLIEILYMTTQTNRPLFTQVVQLKHDLSNKNGLIQMYSDLENEENDNNNKNDGKDKTSLVVNWHSLHDKVLRLEDENQRLRREATVTIKEIEFEEKREILLIRDCAKQLSEYFEDALYCCFWRRLKMTVFPSEGGF